MISTTLKSKILLGLSWILIINLLWACGRLPEEDTKRIAEEMENRELFHVTDGDIVEWVKKDGDSLSNFLNNDFKIDASSKSGKQNSFEDKVQSPVVVIWIFDEISDLEDEKQNDLWQAYQYNFENDLPLEANVQILEKYKTILYTAPIQKGNKVFGIWSLTYDWQDVVSQMSKDK